MRRVLIKGLLSLLLPVCAVSVAHASKTPPKGVIEAGRVVVTVSGLRDAGCPLDGSTSIPSYFHRERSGASYVAETALVLPMTLERTIRTLRSVEEYPRWAFVLRVESSGEPKMSRNFSLSQAQKATASYQETPTTGWLARWYWGSFQ